MTLENDSYLLMGKYRDYTAQDIDVFFNQACENDEIKKIGEFLKYFKYSKLPHKTKYSIFLGGYIMLLYRRKIVAFIIIYLI